MKNRIIGFDVARAYAIFGMYIVNFNTVFGSHTNHKGLSGFLNLFNGNSSSLFVVLAGMGVSLMTSKTDYTSEEKKELKHIIMKRSWFLFFLGVAFSLWWPADILHFYGGYMHFAVLLAFVPRKYLLYTSAIAILIFHAMLAIIPYQTGWNFDTLVYSDFWTPAGFLRNTFYNGWNSIFPWVAYFLFGMYLGRCDWKNVKTINKTLLIGCTLYLFVFFLQSFATSITQDKGLIFYLTAEYLPPFLPFMLGTASFGLILIGAFVHIGNRFENTKIAQILAATGQMTLTRYIAHLVFGLLILSLITGKTLSYNVLNETPTDPVINFAFAITYFLLSCTFSFFWAKRYKNGPLEILMRSISDRPKKGR